MMHIVCCIKYCFVMLLPCLTHSFNLHMNVFSIVLFPWSASRDNCLNIERKLYLAWDHKRRLLTIGLILYDIVGWNTLKASPFSFWSLKTPEFQYIDICRCKLGHTAVSVVQPLCCLQCFCPLNIGLSTISKWVISVHEICCWSFYCGFYWFIKQHDFLLWMSGC